MIFRIPTKRRKLSIDLIVQANNKELILVGFDPDKKNTKYINRLMLVDGIEKFTITLPTTPKFLDILIYDKNQPKAKDDFKVKNISLNNLRTIPIYLDELTREYIDFITDFSLKEGYSEPGEYLSKNNNFKIKLFDKIREHGKEINTSARIHAKKSFIEVSKHKFDEMSIASRMHILLHEFSHNFLNKNEWSEKEADDNAIDIYLHLGYPEIESVYSLTEIFHDSHDHLERLANLDKNLKVWNDKLRITNY